MSDAAFFEPGRDYTRAQLFTEGRKTVARNVTFRCQHIGVRPDSTWVRAAFGWTTQTGFDVWSPELHDEKSWRSGNWTAVDKKEND